MTGTQRGQALSRLVVGVAAAVAALASLDLVHLHLLSGQPFSLGSTTPLVWLGLVLFWLALGAALVPLVAAFATAAAALGRRLERRSLAPFTGRPRLAEAAAVALLCAPPAAAVAWALFQGQGVARTPWLAAAGPFVAAPVLLLAVLAAWLVVAWLRGRGPAVRGLAWVGAAAVLGALFLADARLFVGLYGYLHLTLSLLALWAAIALVRALAPRLASAGPQGPGRGRRFGLLAAGLGGAAAALATLVLVLRAAPEARSDLLERSLYASRGLSLLSPLLPLGHAPELEAAELTYEEIEAEYLRGLPRPAPGAPAGQRPDILLFSIDAVNADRFPGRGYNPEVMPNIHKLLPHAVRFDRAYTTVPETQYAVPGLIMSTHRDVGPEGTTRDMEDTVALALRQLGYGTYWVYEARDLFQGGGVLNNFTFGGFDGRYGIDEERAFAASERVIEILETQGGSRPLFIWTHIFAPHQPYQPPRQFRRFGSSQSGLYDGELAAADAYVGQVLDYLRDRGRLDRTHVVITADHGEWSGEGGRFGHGADVTERTVNVPLLFMGPGLEAPGRRVDEPVSITDVAPTLVELAGGVPPETWHGRSLGPALRAGWERFERGVVLAYTEGKGQVAALLDDYKLVFNRAKTVIRLYDLAADRAETRDLAAAQPERVRDLLARAAAQDLAETVAARVRADGADAALEAYRDQVVDGGATEAERALAARALGQISSRRAPEVIVELLARRGDDPRALGANVRRWLAHSLAKVGAGAQAGQAEAIVADERDDPMVRALALRSLRRTPRATAAAEAWAGDRDVHLRRAAASLLAGDSRARPGPARSAALLVDEDAAVRALAVASLDRLAVADRAGAISRALADDAAPVRLAAAEQCGRARSGGGAGRCLDAVLARVEATTDTAERLALLDAVAPALARDPRRWAALLEGPAPQRALAYEGLGRTAGDFDQVLLDRLEAERDDRAREALIRAVGERRLAAARPALIRQHGEPNFALGQAATEALLRIGLEPADVPALLEVFPRAPQMQTKVNLLHLFGAISRIDDPRVYDLAERMRATPMADHHLIRALVEVYSRLTDPRAERYRVDHPMYTNFGYHFWLQGYSLRPERPRAGEEVELRTVWSTRWSQPAGTANFIHVVGGPRQVPFNRHVVAGRRVDQWPRCQIMVDDFRLRIPEGARHVRLLTGWTRNGRRLGVVYGEHDGQQRGLITEFDVAPAEP